MIFILAALAAVAGFAAWIWFLWSGRTIFGELAKHGQRR